MVIKVESPKQEPSARIDGTVTDTGATTAEAAPGTPGTTRGTQEAPPAGPQTAAVVRAATPPSKSITCNSASATATEDDAAY